MLLSPPPVSTRQEIEEWLEAVDATAIFYQGLDSAIIGLSEDKGTFRVCYRVHLCYEALMNDGMSYKDAVEWFEYNIYNSYMGESTPIFVI